MKEWIEVVATTLTITSTLLGLFYILMKKWFLDLETYKKDKEFENHKLDKLEESITESLNDFMTQMQNQKANADDLARAEQKIEKIDNQIASIASTVEKQSYHIEFLMSSRTEIPEQIKDLHRELVSSLKELREDIASQGDKIVDIQLDIQSLKSKLG